ncbi:hypothetical protein ACH5RR_021284 [Cinchona calisaya]|uniref:Late blight resistance protein R1A-like N-terminal domain-containing protein n=1 Tax=Cinchona calisaya TaxID=153742 RepID=A0ABD2ZK49_9GENT
MQSLSLGLEEDVFSYIHVNDFVHNFHNNTCSLKQEINQFYFTLSDCLKQSGSTTERDELIVLMDSLLENLVDLLTRLIFNKYLEEQIQDLEDNLKFLKNFFGFANFRGVEERQLEDVLTHTEAVAINAAGLFCLCWFDKKDKEVRNELKLKIPELLDKIKPIDPQVCKIYIQVLTASSYLDHHKN